jgi:hypothetical protein
MRAARDTVSTSTTRSKCPMSTLTRALVAVVARTLHAAHHARAAAVGHQGHALPLRPLHQGREVRLAARMRHAIGRVAEVAQEAAHLIAPGAAIGVQDAVPCAGGAERPQLLGRRDARRRHHDVVQVTGQAQRRRGEPHRGLHVTGDGPQALHLGEPIGESPPPVAACALAHGAGLSSRCAPISSSSVRARQCSGGPLPASSNPGARARSRRRAESACRCAARPPAPAPRARADE